MIIKTVSKMLTDKLKGQNYGSWLDGVTGIVYTPETNKINRSQCIFNNILDIIHMYTNWAGLPLEISARHDSIFITIVIIIIMTIIIMTNIITTIITIIITITIITTIRITVNIKVIKY